MRRMIVVLVSVMTLSGLVLAVADSRLRERIEQVRQTALERSMAALFEASGDVSFRQVFGDDLVVYEAFSDTALGYAVRAKTSGYGGPITLLVGLSADRTVITGLAIVEQVETPGLGGRIAEPEFRQQFEGLSPTDQISRVKNREPDRGMNEIQAISGATITTNAVVSAINERVSDAIELIEEQSR